MATRAEVEARISAVAEMIMLGTTYRQIHSNCADQFGVGGRQSDNYIRRARELIAQDLEAQRDVLIAEHVARRRNLYARALQRSDLRTALAVADSEAKLLGLHVERVDVTGAVDVGKLTPEEIAERLQQLEPGGE